MGTIYISDDGDLQDAEYAKAVQEHLDDGVPMFRHRPTLFERIPQSDDLLKRFPKRQSYVDRLAFAASVVGVVAAVWAVSVILLALGVAK